MSNSISSPKSRYMMTAHFSKSLKNVGSHIRITTDDLESPVVAHEIARCRGMAAAAGAQVRFDWAENMATFPEFDWKLIRSHR